MSRIESWSRNAAEGRKTLSWQARRRRRDLIADLELIRNSTSDAHIISVRLGYPNPESLARYLLRAGRPDLARPFFAWAQRNRRVA